MTLAVMLGPVAAGLLGTLAPAFGILPAAGLVEPGLGAFRDLLGWPGLPRATLLSLWTGLAATAASLAIVTMIAACWQGTRTFAVVERLLSPLLSVPHAAAAFGIAFLIAPSGWVARVLSPWLTRWERPPDLLIVQDPAGLALIAGLIAKEVPFLMLMTIAALGQVEARRSVLVAQSLGYGRETAWLQVVLPRVYAQIRLPVYVVLAFSMTVVDVAVILGPNTPPTLSVQVVRWIGDPDLALRLRAAAGAVLQLALVVGALGLWRLGELAVAALGRRWVWSGRRGTSMRLVRPIAVAMAAGSGAAVLLGLAGLALWSVAGFWTYPDALPEGLTLRTWQRFAPALAETAAETGIIAAVATLAALVLTIGCLEAEHRYGLRMTRRAMWLLYLPLLVPQVAFLPGLQMLMLQAGASTGLDAVIAAHVVFVLPYVFLSLGDPFRAWDSRHGTVAHALGAGPDRVLWAVRLPMLLAPVLTAAAVGFAVSVGQYLPTLLIGGGRVQSLTTEAVALASGGDRRAIGAYALAQTAAALLPFALALAVPRLVFAQRRGLRHG
ncbi:ABC transporter permease [Roseitranquillus sediminis]|uniref:ABC transporter permease n=1 Tax=Roseitranquillus sediminis TaxID=2809051 RepID=UPI001D0CBB20|nr:ABC transporter permease subunit [Roseitranquillus sediminis]